MTARSELEKAAIDSCSDVPQDVLEIMQWAASKNSITLAMLIKKGKGSDNVARARSQVDVRFRKRNLSLPMIGRYMRKHHTAVLEMLRQAEGWNNRQTKKEGV
jgi:hypothetical protein